MLDTGFSAHDSALLVFARYPAPGVVKTRLATSIGTAAAAEIYRAFLSDIARRFRGDPRWTFYWAFEPADSPFVAEVADGAPAFAQSGGDLGERMAGAITRAMGEGYRQVVLIGSDVPHLTRDRVSEAFALLAGGAPLVIGPAEDGGYCLVGAREQVPDVFSGIAWGGATVLGQTLDAARRAGIAVRLLAPTYDVDGIDDLERLRSEIEHESVADLAATRGALERLPRLGYR